MPKSKRDKKISLTKTSKKGLALKQQIIEDVRNCMQKYNRIFLITIHNMRNDKLQAIRSEWKGSRFFFGKNKVIALALGKPLEDEVAKPIRKLIDAMRGQCGLLFTNKSKKEVLAWMEEFEEVDYGRSGFVVNETVVLPEGPLPDFSHSIEPHLRQLGMPTALKKGIITLLQDYQVCKQGQPLTPEQARILKLIGRPLASFKVIPFGVYSKKYGYKSLAPSDGSKDTSTMETEDIENT